MFDIDFSPISLLALGFGAGAVVFTPIGFILRVLTAPAPRKDDPPYGPFGDDYGDVGWDRDRSWGGR